VLLVRGALLDVVSHVPPETAGRSEVYLRSVGEATLRIELIDSQTGVVLLRGLDRRAAERHSAPYVANGVTNWMEASQLADFWAKLLRRRLDEVAQRMSIQGD